MAGGGGGHGGGGGGHGGGGGGGHGGGGGGGHGGGGHGGGGGGGHGGGGGGHGGGGGGHGGGGEWNGGWNNGNHWNNGNWTNGNWNNGGWNNGNYPWYKPIPYPVPVPVPTGVFGTLYNPNSTPVYVATVVSGGIIAVDLSVFLTYSRWLPNISVTLPMVDASGNSILVQASTGAIPGTFYLRGYSSGTPIGVSPGSQQIYYR